MSTTGLDSPARMKAMGIKLKANPYGAAALRRTRIETWISRLSWLNLFAVLGVMYLLCFVSEDWWLSGVLTYLPRSPYLLPSILLAFAALLSRPSLIVLNAAAAFIVLVPIMGLTAPVEDIPPVGDSATTLRIVSANAQEGQGGVHRLLNEVDHFEPNIVVLQETVRGAAPILEHYADWQTIHLGAYFVASKFPVRVVDHCRAEAFDRWSAVMCEIDTPEGQIYLANVHLMTPRHGATGLNATSIITGAGVEEFEWHQHLRSQEITEVIEFLSQFNDHPLLIAGDFNAPSTSTMYKRGWSDFQNTFDAAGAGYGYTSPCNTDSIWPSNTPWVRIDHILTDQTFQTHKAEIGQTDGSDHRLIFAEVSRKSQN